jgi:hypothetical protein
VTRPHEPPLTLAQLAARWGIKDPHVALRRVRRWGIPGINVGTKDKPEYVFRLAHVEAWEAANEGPLDAPATAPKPEPPPPGAPVGWDGKVRAGKGRGARGRAKP